MVSGRLTVVMLSVWLTGTGRGIEVFEHEWMNG